MLIIDFIFDTFRLWWDSRRARIADLRTRAGAMAFLGGATVLVAGPSVQRLAMRTAEAAGRLSGQRNRGAVDGATEQPEPEAAEHPPAGRIRSFFDGLRARFGGRRDRGAITSDAVPQPGEAPGNPSATQVRRYFESLGAKGR